jgi:hypothetical protein
MATPNRPEFRADKMAGTRYYDWTLGGQRIVIGAASLQSAAIGVVGTNYTNEVLLHASIKCYVKNGANPVVDNTGIPLEAGEKFHMQITPGDKIAVIQDAAGGFLNIVPVL